MDGVIAVAASLSWVGLAAVVLLAVVLFVRFAYLSARDNARMEVEFADTLAWVRSVAEVHARTRKAPSVARHRKPREMSLLMRWLAARGTPRPAAAYPPPPPLTPEPVVPVRVWPVADVNTPNWPTNGPVSVRAEVPVGFRDAWEEIDVIRARLSGDTGLIPPVIEEVRS